MIKKVEYELSGFIVVSMWGGGKGWKHLFIRTDEEGFKEIEKEPRQDYIAFGVEEVEYAYFDVYRKTIYENEIKRVIIEEKEPIKWIEKGEVDDDLLEKIAGDFSEPAFINY